MAAVVMPSVLLRLAWSWGPDLAEEGPPRRGLLVRNAFPSLDPGLELCQFACTPAPAGSNSCPLSCRALSLLSHSIRDVT